MQDAETLSVALSPEMAAAVRQAVQAGDYASEGEVIREALRLWRVDHAVQDRGLEELRRLWQEGVESGSAGPLDIEKIKAKGRARLERERQPA